ncbi:MAG: hypothetical protein JNJ73_08575 [Hyphomonadaceae bacterium]|nr:hypothetical protein [Hyphomonadaceae bacterium]
MSVRRFTRSEWEARLERYRCKPLAGKTKLNTAEWWRAEWGFIFTVPIDADGCITDADLQSVISDVVGSAPPGQCFDDN